jgi:uncharacterized protein
VRFEVRELWRYPVKSLQGERITSAHITPEGIEGDRRFGILDTGTGLVLTARREPELLFGCASVSTDGEPIVTLPDGSVARDDAALSKWLGRAVHLQEARLDHAATYEIALDWEHEEHGAEWFTWTGPPGAFHDSKQTRVSLVSEGTMGNWDRRRFRANVVLSGSGEEALVGTRARVGAAELDVRKEIDRCVMVTRPQPGRIARDLDVLHAIQRDRNGNLAVGALVATPGRVDVGDVLLGAAPIA